MSTELVPVVRVMVRRERNAWVAEAPADGVWTHGRTLREVDERAQSAIALARDIDCTDIHIQLHVDDPQLDTLRQARDQVETCVAAAVVSLRSQKVSWADIAHVTQIRQRDARELYASATTGEGSRARLGCGPLCEASGESVVLQQVHRGPHLSGPADRFVLSDRRWGRLRR